MGPTPQVIYVSPSFCRLMGASYEDYPLPKAWRDLIHPDDLVALETALREGLRQKTTVEHIHRVAAGTARGGSGGTSGPSGCGTTTPIR